MACKEIDIKDIQAVRLHCLLLEQDAFVKVTGVPPFDWMRCTYIQAFDAMMEDQKVETRQRAFSHHPTIKKLRSYKSQY